MTRKFLDEAYDHIGEGIAGFYDEWADTYEAEVGDNGYVTPDRCARALAACATDMNAPLLDFGCGTGLSGQALQGAGFTAIDGMDLSAEMLAQARKKDLYRSLRQVADDKPLPIQPGDYAAIAAIGVIGPGAAPLGLFDTLVDHLGAGGLFVLSFNDKALEDPAYEVKINEYTDTGTMALRFAERGPHLPARNIYSTVYVLEKQ